MLDAEVRTKAEALVLTICIIRYKSLLSINLNVLDSYKILDDGLKVFDSLDVFDSLEALTSFSQTS